MPYMDCIWVLLEYDNKKVALMFLVPLPDLFLGIRIALSGFRLAGHPGKKTVDTTFTQQKMRNHVLMGCTSTSLQRIG